MRIDVHAINLMLSSDLKDYAEIRIWRAVRRAARRTAWVGLWLTQHPEQSDDAIRYSCRLDVWLRGIGIVTVCHFDAHPYVAIDIAAARLRQAIATKMRQDALGRRIAARRNLRESASTDDPRLAVVIERANLPRRMSLIPWLRAKYGIEQVTRISLPATLWHAAANGDGLAEALRPRLALSLLCRPELIVVLGRAGIADDADNAHAEELRVRRIVGQLRRWSIPIEMLGLWITETWNPECHVESRELLRVSPEMPPVIRDGVATIDAANRVIEMEAVPCG